MSGAFRPPLGYSSFIIFLLILSGPFQMNLKTDRSILSDVGFAEKGILKLVSRQE